MVRAELLVTVRLRHWRLRLCHDMKRDDGARCNLVFFYLSLFIIFLILIWLCHDMKRDDGAR